MNKLEIVLYLLVEKAKMFIHGLVGTIEFVLYLLFSGICFSKNPEASLKVLEKFIRITSAYYPNNVVTGRTLGKSLSLLSILVDKYCQNKSTVLIDQLLHIYKEEFLRRGNGRK